MRQIYGMAFVAAFAVMSAVLVGILMPLALSRETPPADRAGYLGAIMFLAYAAPRFIWNLVSGSKPIAPPPAPEGEPPAKPKR